MSCTLFPRYKQLIAELRDEARRMAANIAKLESCTVVLREFCDSVERHDGKRFADLFCKDGVYHDVFYGEFAGRFS
jgi:hypothetical protein